MSSLVGTPAHRPNSRKKDRFNLKLKKRLQDRFQDPYDEFLEWLLDVYADSVGHQTPKLALDAVFAAPAVPAALLAAPVEDHAAAAAANVTCADHFGDVFNAVPVAALAALAAAAPSPDSPKGKPKSDVWTIWISDKLKDKFHELKALGYDKRTHADFVEMLLDKFAHLVPASLAAKSSLKSHTEDSVQHPACVAKLPVTIAPSPASSVASPSSCQPITTTGYRPIAPASQEHLPTCFQPSVEPPHSNGQEATPGPMLTTLFDSKEMYSKEYATFCPQLADYGFAPNMLDFQPASLIQTAPDSQIVHDFSTGVPADAIIAASPVSAVMPPFSIPDINTIWAEPTRPQFQPQFQPMVSAPSSVNANTVDKDQYERIHQLMQNANANQTPPEEESLAYVPPNNIVSGCGLFDSASSGYLPTALASMPIANMSLNAPLVQAVQPINAPGFANSALPINSQYSFNSFSVADPAMFRQTAEMSNPTLTTVAQLPSSSILGSTASPFLPASTFVSPLSTYEGFYDEIIHHPAKRCKTSPSFYCSPPSSTLSLLPCTGMTQANVPNPAASAILADSFVSSTSSTPSAAPLLYVDPQNQLADPALFDGYYPFTFTESSYLGDATFAVQSLPTELDGSFANGHGFDPSFLPFPSRL
ncbi:uncharacterized protein BJ171DRAFT_479474 [Polychytrium aggregatum]|uniref:uncharacterized protein n=1 Tax=Polychytrium aggregatum TaxID=110093 RepID=UPI0022FE6400|nr:uncharacterized protein BJ171DRAFT_479474 [Polychytrium aggregatum]KAI9193346.1 hypothetical protein BJ171DRAFT_479474 [Polychytrium aggregatum]